MHSLLVIEDDELLALLLHRVLTQAGYACTTVLKLGDVAHRVEQLGSVDLVLTDVFFEETTSFETVHGVKTLFPEASVVVMSGHSREYVKRQGRGWDDDWLFIQKPFSTSDLLELVAQQLNLKPGKEAENGAVNG